MDSLDTLNKFGVGVLGEKILIAMPVPAVLSKADALNLAAWLAALADLFDCGEFDRLLTAVRNT